MTLTLRELIQARGRLLGIAVHTPLVRAFAESTAVPHVRHTLADVGLHTTGAEEFYIKAESLQPIGSFKLRGAYNKIAQLTAAERARGVITYSSGNHAQGVAYAARAVGARSVIVMPVSAPEIKQQATAALGAEIVHVGDGSEERRDKALALAAEHGYVVIPPYDDEAIIAGQGTAGLEIFDDLPDVELVLVPVGGGGLSSGIATALKLSGSRARVFGVEPELANDAQQSLQAGSIMRIEAASAASTIADGLRTQSIGHANFALLTTYLDGIITVSEDEIRRTMRRIILEARLTAEPSGSVATAAWLYHRSELPPSRKTVAVLSGGNAEPRQIAQILEER
jgi:threonine dehydratase